MVDRVPVQALGNGAIRYGIYNADGSLNRYEYIKLEDGATVTGTPLNKANLLTDAVAAALGGSSASVPNDIFKLLAARYGTCSTAASTAAKVGTLSNFVLSTGAVVGIKFTNANTASNPTLNVNSTGAKAIYCGGAASVSGQITAGMMALFQYDGTYWQLLNPALPHDITKIAIGSYTGTGTFGLANAKLLTFAFAPKLGVIVQRTARYFDYMFFVSSLTTDYTSYGYMPISGTENGSNDYAKISADGLTVYWYHTGDAGGHLNTTGEVYDYVFMG